jgi:RNA polymerase sigma-70 factor (ECF subfamily)
MELSDEKLYRRIRKGDREAFVVLYERREPALYRYALQISGNRAIAEEATQEAFLQLIRPDPRFDERRGSSLESYLYGVVRNLARAARRGYGAAIADEPAAEDDLVRSLIGGERALALYAAMRELPDAYREAVMLCDIEERSYEDAAGLMGCPVGTVRSRLYRARRLLAAKLSRHRLAPQTAEG